MSCQDKEGTAYTANVEHYLSFLIAPCVAIVPLVSCDADAAEVRVEGDLEPEYSMS
jgi:hypothetical protein